MKSLFATISIALVVTYGLTRTSWAADKERDLREYDLAGPFSLDQLSRHKEDRAIIEEMIRDFLWTRWQKHRLAQVATVEYSTEGLPARTWYYVEPDKNGVWRIAIDDDITIPAFKRDSQEHQREARFYEAYSLERVETKNSDAAGQLIGEKEVREPETYRLRLKGRDGQIIREL
jgi:hypothetical protein